MEKIPQQNPVDKIIQDYTNRKLFWDSIDPELQVEIRQALKDIIQKEKDPEKAVKEIMCDLDDRRMLADVDEDILEEIRQAWISIMKQ